MKIFKKLVVLSALIALLFGIIAYLPNEKSISAKESYTVDFGYNDVLEGIKHKFGTLKNGSTLCMYNGQSMAILNPAYDIVVTKGDPDIVSSTLGTNSNYITATKVGEASVDLLLNPEDENMKVSFKLKVVDDSILEEFAENISFSDATIKLKYKNDVLTGKVSIKFANSSKSAMSIKLLNMCARNNDSKFQKLSAGKSKTIKATFKEIEQNEHFDRYYPLTEKEIKNLAKGKTVKAGEFNFETVIKYKDVYIF